MGIRMKGFLITLMGCLFAFLLAPTGECAAKVLKVGVIGPFTGPAARTGEEMRGAVRMAFDNIGNQIGDYTVELVWIDSQSDPAKATNAYSEAVEKDKVQVTVGNWHSSVAAALMDQAAAYKVPHIGALGAAGITTDKYKDDAKYKGYWMKGWPTPSKLTQGYADCLNDAIKKGLWNPSQRLAAVYGEDTDWGHDVATSISKQLGAYGWKIALEDYFPITQTDFYPLFGKYKRAGVTVVAGTSSAAATVSAFIKQIREVGVEAVVIADGLGWIGEWYDLTGPDSNYVLDMIPRFATPQAKQFAKDIKERFGFDPSPSASGIPYDFANYLIKVANVALKKHGSLDKSTIHKVMVDDVCTGKLTYGASDGALIMKKYEYSEATYNDPVVGRDAFYFPVIQYMNGEGYIVYPDDWKEKEPVFKY